MKSCFSCPSHLFSYRYILIMTCKINKVRHTVQFSSAPPSLCENLLIRTCTRSWGDLHLLHLSFGSLFLALFPVLVTAELHPLAETAVIIIRGMGGERDPVNVWMLCWLTLSFSTYVRHQSIPVKLITSS